MNFKSLFNFIFIPIFLSSCIATKNKNYTFNQKYSAAKVKEDIVLLKKILEANHPSLYWYTTKDSIDYFFTETLANITDSLSEIQAKNKIAFIVSNIKCGHTSVRFSKQFIALADKNKYPQFPLSIKTWKDSMVVLGYYNKEDSSLKRGTIITSINGKSGKEIVEKTSQVISSDGYAYNYKSQVISGNFPAWMKNIYGVDSSYLITYLDSNKIEKSITIKAHSPKIDTTKKAKDSLKIIVKKQIEKISKKQIKQSKLLALRSFTIDTSINTGFIRLTTFSEGKLRHFINKTFEEIQEKKIKNLVIDVRENGGGNVGTSIYLLKHLMDSSFKIADTVAGISRKFEYRNHIKNWFQYWLLKNILFIAIYYLLQSIIQGGYTFSAATILSSFLKGQSNVTIIGEESGGGFYGNSAMNIPNIILPNTKLQVRLPMYRYVMNKTRPKGKGLVPDVEIYPSSNAIKNGIDLKILAIRKLIEANNKSQ